jgi:hypothetical protein
MEVGVGAVVVGWVGEEAEFFNNIWDIFNGAGIWDPVHLSK